VVHINSGMIMRSYLLLLLALTLPLEAQHTPPRLVRIGHDATIPLHASADRVNGRNAFDPDVTSDKLRGTVSVAVFYVTNTRAAEQGVPTWNDALRDSSHANLVRNLAWLGEQAAAYGHATSFTVRSYWPDDPVCAIDFDPTEGAGRIGNAPNDTLFQLPIMRALGYASDARSSMRAFCNDLRSELQTDWAFIAFLLAGRGEERSHAQRGGPALVMMGVNAAEGYVFAHETAHVFNALDEYYDPLTALWSARQMSRDLPNGNLDFRNHPVMPSIMGGPFLCVSGYTAVHLGLADSLSFTRITPTPPTAVFSVEYLAADGSVMQTSRYQGVTRFAWGRGMRIRLRAVPVATHEGMRWDRPVWDATGTALHEFTHDAGTPAEVTLTLTRSATPRDINVDYLTTGDGLASEIVHGVHDTKTGRVVLTGPKGISVLAGDTIRRFDLPLQPGASATVRESTAAASNPDGTLFITSQAGQIVVIPSAQPFALQGPDSAITYRSIAVDAAGVIWASDGAVVAGRTYPASALHRFSGDTVHTLARGILPSDSITTIAAAGTPHVWIGLGGATPADQGLYRYDPLRDERIDMRARLAHARVVKLRAVGHDSLLVLSRRGDGGAAETFVSLLTSTADLHWEASLFRQLGLVNDLALDASGALVVATMQGVSTLRPDRTWMRLQTTNTELPTNICLSIASLSDGDLLVGTNDGAVRIARSRTPTAVADMSPPVTPEISQIHPLPVRRTLTATISGDERGIARLLLVDPLGRVVADLGERDISPNSTTHTLLLPSELPSGVYMLTIEMEGRRIARPIPIVR
jgi:hypothetical protein